MSFVIKNIREKNLVLNQNDEYGWKKLISDML